MKRAWSLLGERIRHFFATLAPNIRVQAFASLLGGLYRGAFSAVWQPFVLHLTDSVRFLGLLESLGGWGGVVSSMMQLVGGWLADRLGRRSVLLLSSLFAILSFLVFTLAALLHLWSLLVPGAILLGMSLLGRAAQSSVTAESVGQERRGLAFSVTMAAFAASSVVSSVVGGQVSERWGYLPVMLAALVLEAVVLATLFLFLRETLSRKAAPIGGQERRGLLRALRLPRQLWRLVIPFSGDAFAFGVSASILFGILTDAYQFTEEQLGWINACFFLSWALAQLPVGRLVDRYGCKKFLVVAEAGLGVCILIWLLWPTFVGVLIGYLLLGITAALWVPALFKLLAGHVAEQQRGIAMGLIFTAQSLARFPGPYLQSLLYESWGYPAPLLIGLGGVVLVVVSMVLLIEEPPVEQVTSSANSK